MSKKLLKEQKEALVGRAVGLVENLERDLKSVDNYNKTIPIVKKYIEDIEEEFGFYVVKVKRSKGSPGRPCSGDEIWCLPLMRCATPEDCDDAYQQG